MRAEKNGKLSAQGAETIRYAGAQLSMIILAGGKSARMGTDKADLLYQGKTFLEMQIAKGKALGIEDILVSGYRGQRCLERIVPDRLEGRGPLGGLEACLRQAVHEKCLLLSVDVPLLSLEELRRLIDCSRKNESAITILQHGEKQEPLIGIYSVKLADAIEERLQRGWGSVFRFIQSQGYRCYQSAGDERQFLNINESQDYRLLGGGNFL